MTFRACDRSNHILRTVFLSFSFCSISYHRILQKEGKWEKMELQIKWEKFGAKEEGWKNPKNGIPKISLKSGNRVLFIFNSSSKKRK